MIRSIIVLLFLSAKCCCAETFHTDAFTISDFSVFPEEMQFLSNFLSPLPDGELGILVRTREPTDELVAGYQGVVFTTDLIEDNTAARLTMSFNTPGFPENKYWSVAHKQRFDGRWMAGNLESNWYFFPPLDVPIEESFYIGTAFDVTPDDGGFTPEVFGWVELQIDLRDLSNIKPVILSSAITHNMDHIIIGELETEPQPLAGDITEDGIVNSADLNVVGLNWQQHVNGFRNGDITGDGFVDSADLNVIGLDWQKSVPLAITVPEPSFCRWPLLLLIAVRHHRRRNRFPRP